MRSKTLVQKTETKQGTNFNQVCGYLQYLQNLIDENNRKEVELIMRLKTLELKAANRPSENIPIRIGYTSAEKHLEKLGLAHVLRNISRTC